MIQPKKQTRGEGVQNPGKFCERNKWMPPYAMKSLPTLLKASHTCRKINGEGEQQCCQKVFDMSASGYVIYFTGRLNCFYKVLSRILGFYEFYSFPCITHFPISLFGHTRVYDTKMDKCGIAQ